MTSRCMMRRLRVRTTDGWPAQELWIAALPGARPRATVGLTTQRALAVVLAADFRFLPQQEK